MVRVEKEWISVPRLKDEYMAPAHSYFDKIVEDLETLCANVCHFAVVST